MSALYVVLAAAVTLACVVYGQERRSTTVGDLSALVVLSLVAGWLLWPVCIAGALHVWRERHPARPAPRPPIDYDLPGR